jgi:hypothetical protein
MRMISRCGIARSFARIPSSFRVPYVSGSPPETTTSRTAFVRAMYSTIRSISTSGTASSYMIRLRVQ